MKGPISIRDLIIGFLVGVVTLAVIAWFYGPKVSSLEEDPLTGRHQSTIKWLGATIDSHVVENEVSRWADKHSIQGIYPARYGWIHISSSWRGWFNKGGVGCMGGFDLPGRIFREQIKLDGLTKEEALRKYQTELVENCKQSRSYFPVIEEWGRKAQAKDSEAPSGPSRRPRE